MGIINFDIQTKFQPALSRWSTKSRASLNLPLSSVAQPPATRITNSSLALVAMHPTLRLTQMLLPGTTSCNSSPLPSVRLGAPLLLTHPLEARKVAKERKVEREAKVARRVANRLKLPLPLLKTI